LAFAEFRDAAASMLLPARFCEDALGPAGFDDDDPSSGFSTRLFFGDLIVLVSSSLPDVRRFFAASLELGTSLDFDTSFDIEASLDPVFSFNLEDSFVFDVLLLLSASLLLDDLGVLLLCATSLDFRRSLSLRSVGIVSVAVII
jgi:hypothetical protein